MNWNDITLRKWQQIRKADKLADPNDRSIAIIAAVHERTPDEVCALPIRDFIRLKDAASFVLEDMPAPQRTIATSYRFGGFDLRPQVDINHWTTIQFIDFQTLAERGEDALVPLLSVLLVPKGCKYGDGYDMGAAQEALLSMPVTFARDLVAFFVSGSLTSALRGLASSVRRELKEAGLNKRRLRRATRALLKDLTAAGAGSIASTALPHPLGDPGTPWNF